MILKRRYKHYKINKRFGSVPSKTTKNPCWGFSLSGSVEPPKGFLKDRPEPFI